SPIKGYTFASAHHNEPINLVNSSRELIGKEFLKVMAFEPIVVGIAEIAATIGTRSLICTGLGSSVAVCAYDPFARVAGMAYVILPECSTNRTTNKPAKYANTAIPALMEAMQQEGADPLKLKVALAGGSKMILSNSLASLYDIGTRNVEALNNCLKAYDIEVVAVDVGGSDGRTIAIYSDTGKVVVNSSKTVERVLCELGESAVKSGVS
ncbi:MAG: chemotaxis protein CheD, partial [bacterium]